MSKIHPCSSSQELSLEREVFTIWMKSLVFNGNGCTVYDSGGRIIYRVDNYDCKGGRSTEVFLMDLGGKVLFKILKKRFRVWEGYSCKKGPQQEELMKPWFKVKKPCRILKDRRPYCEFRGEDGFLKLFHIDGFPTKSSFKIVDVSGHLVAEAKRKETASGIAFGDDVLSLVVEPNIDHCLVIGLVIVHGMMHHSL